MTLGFLQKLELDNALELLGEPLQQTYYMRVKSFLQDKYHKNVKLVNSGSEALYRVFMNIQSKMKNKDILMPAYTCYAPIRAAVTSGLKPVLVDATNNFGIDIDLCMKAENVGAILAVHLYGIPLDIKYLREVAEAKSAILIEDCAQSYGAKIEKKEVGMFGDYSVLSFRVGKHISGITGGAILSEEDVSIYEKTLTMTYLKSEIDRVKRTLGKSELFPESVREVKQRNVYQGLRTLYSLGRKIGKVCKINLQAYAHKPGWEEGIMSNAQSYLTYTQLMKEKQIIDERNKIAAKIFGLNEKDFFSRLEIRPNSVPSFIAVPLICKNRKKLEKKLRKNGIRYQRRYEYSNVQLFPFLKRIGGKKSILISKEIITFSTDPFDALSGNYDKLEAALGDV